MRNAILQAAETIHGGEDRTRSGRVFAARGMGWSADTVTRTTVQPSAGYDLPPAPRRAHARLGHADVGAADRRRSTPKGPRRRSRYDVGETPALGLQTQTRAAGARARDLGGGDAHRAAAEHARTTSRRARPGSHTLAGAACRRSPPAPTRRRPPRRTRRRDSSRPRSRSPSSARAARACSRSSCGSAPPRPPAPRGCACCRARSELASGSLTVRPAAHVDQDAAAQLGRAPRDQAREVAQGDAGAAAARRPEGQEDRQARAQEALTWATGPSGP